MTPLKKDFILKVHAAYQALAEVRCHALAPPGIKGIQVELLEVAEISHTKMMETVSLGWPSLEASTQEPAP